MADWSVEKREATISDDSDHQPPNKRPRLDRHLNESDNLTTPNVDVARLFSRPLLESPIFSYDDLIEDVEEELKNMKKPVLHHPDLKVRMDYLDKDLEYFLLDQYYD